MRELFAIAASIGLALGVALAACRPDDGKPTDPIKPLAADAGAEGGAGGAPIAPGALGADCTVASQCDSGTCSIGNSASYCSLPCTPDDAARVCSDPVFAGKCNQRGLCGKPK